METNTFTLPTRRGIFLGNLTGIIITFIIFTAFLLFMIYVAVSENGSDETLKSFLFRNYLYGIAWLIGWLAVGTYLCSNKQTELEYVADLQHIVRNNRWNHKMWIERKEYAVKHPEATDLYPMKEYEEKIQEYFAIANNALGELRMIFGSDYEVAT